METVWTIVNWKRIFSPIECELPLFNPVCNSPNNATKVGCRTILIDQKINHKFRVYNVYEINFKIDYYTHNGFKLRTFKIELIETTLFQFVSQL